jgi:signal-transduction protein with cAMP-binding, CBS, and nucleotidyltransferase domain
MSTIPRVGDLPFGVPIAVPPSTTIAETARAMRARNVSALVVGSPGDLISIVTERDLTQALADGFDCAAPVVTIASPDPLTVTPDTEVLEAAVVMLRAGVRHLVVAQGGRAMGVVSMRDALAALVGVVSLGALCVADHRSPTPRGREP